MGILDFIKRDANQITKNTGDFAGPLTFIDESGLEVELNALHTLHYLGYDLERAQEINTRKAHVCVSEEELTNRGYQTRNTHNEVTFQNHKLRAKEANGQEWLYVINEWFPNGRTGTISLILGMHKQ